MRNSVFPQMHFTYHSITEIAYVCHLYLQRHFLMQGTQKIQTAYTTIDTDAQAYIASMLELHHETKQLRENLRKQHRIWMDFYATIFRVSFYLSMHMHARSMAET